MDPFEPSRRRQTESDVQPSPQNDHDAPQTPIQHDTRPPGRIRALTDTLRGRTPSTRSPQSPGGNYSPLTDADREWSPTRPSRAPAHGGGLLLTIPNERPSAITQAQITSPTSPLDAVGFQAALAGIPGLDYGMSPHAGPSSGPSSFPPGPFGPSSDHHHFRPPHSRNPSLPGSINTVRTTDSDVDNFSNVSLADNMTVPIVPYAAPISGAQGQDRGKKRLSVHFGPTVSTTMLGDDLNRAEQGALSPISRQREGTRPARPASPTSPLLKTGKTILRQMSQRIVNLSNEQDVVERAIRRKASVKDTTEELEMQPVATQPSTLDGTNSTENITSPLEKTPSVEDPPIAPLQRSSPMRNNPFLGKSLGVFSPENRLRMKLCDLLLHPWTEPIVFGLIILQTILLAIDSNRTVQYNNNAELRFGKYWIDYFILVLFVIYTLELGVRIIVSGFILNPRDYSTINRKIGWRRALRERMRMLFGTPHTRPRAATMDSTTDSGPAQPSLLRSFTLHGEIQHGDSRQNRRARLAQRAFLRHSFNRVDFIAVCAYWISFAMSIFAIEQGRHIFVFRMLSCLRIMRLLYLTSGTTVILRSLKKAAPLLLNVAFLIGFFWLLFAVIGVQSFKSSLRRQCVWVNPDNETDTWVNNFQFCGGYINASTLEAMPWQKSNGEPGTNFHKGYLCPQYSICKEGKNPYNGSVSFDNIAQSLELIFVIMSSNTFSDLMYYLTNSDYLAAAIFFAVGIVIMMLWLVNLLIAVITSSFQVIREEGKASAFTGQDEDPKASEQEEEESKSKNRKNRKNKLKNAFDKTKWAWITVITLGLIVQCMKSATMSPSRASFISITETAVTLLLVVEIILRIAVDRKNFFKSKMNCVDLGIAVITAIIQIPPIHDSGEPYAWLTFFQIIRIYRVVLAVPITRDLVMVVLGNVSGLLNLILFVFLFTFLAAILAAQMFRGSIPETDPESGDTIEIQFKSIWNSFLGMYIIFSSENWTSIMYTVTSHEILYNTAWMAAGFFIIWYILSNFIVLNMFIAVIQENFDVSEDEKRLQQVKAFLENREAGMSSGHGNLSLSTIFRYGVISGRRQDPSAFGSSAATELLLKDAVVKDFLDQNDDPSGMQSPSYEPEEPKPHLRPAPTAVVRSGTLSSVWTSFVGKLRNEEPNPFYSRIDFNRAGEEMDPTQMAKEVMSAAQRRKRAQREYLHKHPTYNVSMYIFKPENKLRRICQRIVGPGRGGDRIEGLAPSIPVWYAFSAFIYASIVAMVVLACVTTPLYQKEYFQTHKFSPKNWFVFSDLGFAILFTVEAAIKVIADGFFWTPNAYFRSSWGFIDGVVLITLWINVGSSLLNAGQVSRAVGAFKALRALRLLNVSDSARENFHAVIVRGGLKVISAMFVSLSLLIPFAIYGLNLFSNKMKSCNDDNNGSDLNFCVGEYGTNNPFNWDVYSPRVVDNSYYSFDDFGSALFILFQIVSQEGWTDVMWSAQSITGVFQQPRPFASQGNAVFFIMFNLLGAVFVLTLFVSVFMRNYTEMTGVAFLTSDQRSWLELRKLLRQISPSKRPTNRDRQKPWKKLVYRLAITKTGNWQRFVTFVLVLHLIVLCLDFYPIASVWEKSRDFLFLAFTLVYVANITIRLIGLTWPRFRKSSWDIYAVISVTGTLLSTIAVLIRPNTMILDRIHKLFLVSIALLLIPRNNQLDQLFKTAAASLPLIVNLLATWFVMFLVFAIALTQTFGLTKFGGGEDGNINFRNVPKALILLFRISIGEGWNQVMEDLAHIRPPFCVEGDTFQSDCGSVSWARFLFIAWNILSMYIFVNLFVSLIYESFSYVYQRSSGLSVISREEIRRFKEAWAVVDPDGTGYIDKDKLPKLLRELSGVFEMRIYDGDFTVKRLLDDCSKAPRPESGFSTIGHTPEAREIDLNKLNARLRALPVFEIRRRRARLNQFYEEVLVSSERDRGISFNTLLMILAHYKVINDSKSLRLSEFLRRRARLQRVDEQVRRQIVIGFFDTIHWRRKMRRRQEALHAGRLQTIPQFTVPEIFVEDEDDINRPIDGQYNPALSSGPSSRASSPTPGGIITPPDRNSIQISPLASPSTSPPRLTPQHTGSDISGPGSQEAAEPSGSRTDLLNQGDGLAAQGGRSRSNSAVSVQEVLDALDQSAWGASLRRSASMRRPEQRREGRGS